MDELVIKIKEKSDSLIESLGFSGEAIITRRDSVYFVNYIIEDSPAFLIGRGGDALDALQHIVRVLTRGDGLPYGYSLVVDINNYKTKKSGLLEKRAREIAHKVRESGREEELEPMNSYERRVIHTIITNIADVESGSIGEREDRRVVIKPKKNK
jgi:spoIIIJ-associated protein